MSLILAKSNYIEVADNVYEQLEQYQDTFELEVNVLNYAKCILARNEELEDFYTNGINVSVFQNSKGYSLQFNNYVINIEVFDSQIIDFDFNRN